MAPPRTPGEQAAWEAHLFERHSRAELATWAPRLRFFRYWRAPGGLAGGDADELLVAFRVPTRADLERVLGGLGIPLVVLGPGQPEPVPGRAYSGTEWAAFPQRIHGLPGVEQPGHVDLGGVRAHAWVAGGRLKLCVLDPDHPFDVTDRSKAGARWLEPLVAPLAADLVDPPRDDEHCVCPQHHPELWPS